MLKSSTHYVYVAAITHPLFLNPWPHLDLCVNNIISLVLTFSFLFVNGGQNINKIYCIEYNAEIAVKYAKDFINITFILLHSEFEHFIRKCLSPY